MRKGGREQLPAYTLVGCSYPTRVQHPLGFGEPALGGRGLSLGPSLIKQGKDLRASLFSREPLATGVSRGRKARR